MSEQLYSIKETTLTDIGDALRRRHGATRIETVIVDETIPDKEISKTNNAIGFENWNGYMVVETALTYKPVTIQNASSIRIKYNVNFGSTGSTLYIADGVHTKLTTIYSNPNHIVSGNTEGTREITFENTNSVTFCISSTVGSYNCLGYYAEVWGLDADGNALGEQIQQVEKQVEVKNTFSSDEFAQAIDDIVASDLPEEAFIITGDCRYRFAYNSWNWFIELYKNNIKTKNISNGDYMFYANKSTEFPFEINFVEGGAGCNMMFGLTEFEEIPSIDFKQTKTYKDVQSCFQATMANSIGILKNLYPNNFSGFFKNCYNLRYLPEFEDLNLSRLRSYSYSNASSLFEQCQSLREIPEDFLKEIYGIWTSSYQTVFNNGFSYCYSLDEIRGLNPQTGTMTSNMFSGTFNSCDRAKELIFAVQDDGTPYSVNWKGQIIDLTKRYGWGNYNSSSDTRAMCLLKNSGITADKEVITYEDYQALKDDADWFTVDYNYSRYNHDSAVRTIQSLPDTSAYLATAGGTNTIKFKGEAGIMTDGGAINTLTAEEIAVATAKGWTVSLV